jgi:ABC-type lipoprotein release transport system permease subunit
VGESLAIGVIGGVVGILLAVYPAWLLATKGIHIGERTAASTVVAETVRGELSLNAVLTAFAIGLVMAVLGSIGPALRAASIQPVSAMRSGR